MMKLKTEQDKVSYIKEFAEKNDATKVRKEIGKVWGLKKTARNDLYRKLFKPLAKWGVAGEKLKAGDLVYDEKDGKTYKCLASWTHTPKAAAPKVIVNGDKATVEIKDALSIRTVDDLLKYAEVDLTEWAISKKSVNVWDGKYQIKAELVRRKDEKNINSLIERFINQAKEHSPTVFDYEKPAKTADCFYVLSVVDPHFGKLAQGSSTGYEDYKIEIAKEYYKKTVEDLLNNAPINKIGKVGIIIGSDAIHIENTRAETSSGTKIDGDTRWHKIFDDTCELMAETIELLASRFEVEVIVMPGNHSRLTEYAMGAYIKTYFRHHPNVRVDNQPLPRKYFSHGKTLFGVCHGDGVKKLEELGAILFRENLEILSKHRHFYYLTGHKHRFQSVVDERGVRIFVSGAICPPDDWHSTHNFTGAVQSAEAYLFSPENGLEQIIFSKPLNKK
jgi:hypothetical protein